MAQTVYVLTALMESGEHRPVAVVTDEHVADQWGRMTKENDWIPFEIDDLSLTGLAADVKTTFRPTKPTEPSEKEAQLRELVQELRESNKRLREQIDLLAGKIRGTKKKGFASDLLKKK